MMRPSTHAARFGSIKTAIIFRGTVKSRIRLQTTFPQPKKEIRTMGSTSDKAKGLINEGVGKAKQGIGKATDNERLQGEGFVQERKGEAQQLAGEAKKQVKKAVDNI